LQWLEDPSEIYGDNLNNVRRKASRHFRKKKREYLKDKIIELATNSKNKNIRVLYRGINEFKRSYQPRSSLVKLIPKVIKFRGKVHIQLSTGGSPVAVNAPTTCIHEGYCLLAHDAM
jgi:hypothetical protein